MKEMKDWTVKEWEVYDNTRILYFEKINGYRPVKSPNCCGCPSWPFAPCFRCGMAIKEEAAKYLADEGDW